MLQKISSKFTKYLEGKASGTVSLVGPSGNTWHVGLIQHNGNLFFHDEWPAFVQDHTIERGDALVLVFSYDGDLHFTLQVFDQSSCEKEAAFSAECTQDHGNSGKLLGWKRKRVYGASSLEDIVQGVPKKARGSHAYSGCMINHQEEGWRPEEVVSVPETCQTAMYANENRNCCSPSMDAFSFTLPLQLKVPDDNSGAIIEKRNGKESELGSSAGD